MPTTLAQPVESSDAARPRRRAAVTAPAGAATREYLKRFVATQPLNSKRHAGALRPFGRDEFGIGPAAPSLGHITAANALIVRLRRLLLAHAARLDAAAKRDGRALQRLLVEKERAINMVKQVERVWDFYFELFGQRQSRFGEWLRGIDRIALDCYQAVYTGLDVARSIPAPAPFSYMETGFTPATFRRGVSMPRLGRRANPFPIIELPYHRLVNPWTLGAVHHEVCHNLQADLGLWQEVPRRIVARLREADIGRPCQITWARWHKEIWADLCGLLLGGPALIASLFDLLAKTPATVLRFKPKGVHPTPYLRSLVNLELLRRMGFASQAAAYGQLWARLYPPGLRTNIPPALLRNFPRANRLVVDTVCFRPYRQLGDKSLAQVVRFKPEYEQMVRESARRLAAGTDPGVIPERFLVGAARAAIDQKLTAPGKLTTNFYRALSKR